MLRFSFVLASCLLGFGAQAQTVYKCVEAGKTSYADRPCPGGRSTELPPAAGIGPTEVVQTGDSRTLLELEKLREKQRSAERRERIKREEREEREMARASRAASARRQKCDKLRLRQKWAEEDAAHAVGNGREAAQRKARRQAQSVAVECRS